MNTHEMPHARLSGLVALLLLAFGSVVPAAAAGEPAGATGMLTAVSGQGAGQVILASTAEDGGTFHVQITITIHSAQPNTRFILERTADFAPVGTCTSTTWTRFSEPWDIVDLVTSSGGAGAVHFDMGRPFTSGTQFDVQVRARGDDGSLLASECLTLTVK